MRGTGEQGRGLEGRGQGQDTGRGLPPYSRRAVAQDTGTGRVFPDAGSVWMAQHWGCWGQSEASRCVGRLTGQPLGPQGLAVGPAPRHIQDQSERSHSLAGPTFLSKPQG